MEDSCYGYVYLVRNMATNRAYIGQKKGAFNKNYFGSGKLIRRALEKHGKKMFQRQILEYCNTQEELDSREIHYISVYRKLWTPGLYNITNGGSGLNGYRSTPEQIAALVKRSKENPPRKGVRLPQEQVERQRKSLSEFWKNNPEKLKAKAKLNQKRVMCKENGVIYDSLKDASGGDKSLHVGICMACKGKIKTSHGLHWEYVDE